MATYEVPEHTWGSLHHPMHGEVSFDFEPGVIEPRSEHEEYALAYLAERGLARLYAAPSTPAPSENDDDAEEGDE